MTHSDYALVPGVECPLCREAITDWATWVGDPHETGFGWVHDECWAEEAASSFGYLNEGTPTDRGAIGTLPVGAAITVGPVVIVGRLGKTTVVEVQAADRSVPPRPAGLIVLVEKT